MAKWGEGDPRWIVEERPDATNVNNWHWKESNAGPWSKEQFKKLFVNFKIAADNFECNISEIEKMEGEATANNRKAKLIFFYEWNLILKWDGLIMNDENKKKAEGKITIPNLSEENSLDEIDIQVTVNESNEQSEILKNFMYKLGRDRIREQVGKYIESLKNDFAKNLILPKKDEIKSPTSSSISTTDKQQKTLINDFKATTLTAASEKKENPQKSLGVKIDCKTLTFNESFHCKANELYDVFKRKEMVAAFTRGDVKYEFAKGGQFDLFGGNITGKFLEITPNKITQTWRYKQWPSEHYSNVEMEFIQKEDHTELKIKQSLVPSSEYENTKINWSRYYFDSIRSTFGFGTFLF